MDTLVPIIKYIFVFGVVVEIALILRALVALALGKARAAEQVASAAEE